MTSFTVKHHFQSAIADDPTSASNGEVLPSHWNASHDVTALTVDIVDDTTPQLGGNLDLNSHDVTGTGNVSITGNVSVTDDPYDAVTWNGSTNVPTKNAIRDKIESLGVLSDGDKGDITVSSSGTVWTIDNDVVTYAKMQNVSATSRVLGRITAGAGDTEELTGSNVRTIAGLATSDSPQFTAIELGNASDTTIARVSGGVISVEGKNVALNGTGETLTTGTIELGAASDTTIARQSAGHLSVEGHVIWDDANDGTGSGLDADLLDGKNTGTSGNTIPLLDGANTWSALQTFSLGGVTGRFVNTTDNASVQVAKFEGDRATMAANDEAYLSYILSDSAGNQDEFARLTWKGVDVTSTTNDARLIWSVAINDALTAKMRLEGSNLTPDASDGTALGTGSLMWSDLFLASGGVLNFNNGNMTVTHAAGTLTVAGGTLVLPNAGLQMGSSVPFSDSSGTLTLQNVDVLDATTESTIEAAIDTLANLTSVQGVSVALADEALDVLWGWDDSAGTYKNMTNAVIATEAGPAAGDFLLIMGAEGDLRKTDWSNLPGGGGGSPGGSTGQIQYKSGGGTFGGSSLWRNDANTITQSNSTTAQQFIVYNTTDTDGGSPTNYERGTFDWTTNPNSFTIGTQKGGTGSGRNVRFVASGPGGDHEFTFSGSSGMSIAFGDIVNASTYTNNTGFNVGGGMYYGFGNATPGTVDVAFSRNTTSLVQIVNPNSLTSGTGLQVYNTTDAVGGAPTNYERAVFDWTTSSNVLTIGAQKGGTGTLRSVVLTGASSSFDNALTLATGAAGLAPLKFVAGTNLTTATAGACEFDGIAFYQTSVASARQVVNTEQISILTGDRTGTNLATAQAIFGSSEDVISLAATTTYEFEQLLNLTRSTGTTSHTTSVLYAISSGMTITSMDYVCQSAVATGSTLGAMSQIMGTSQTGVVVTAAQTGATENLHVWVRGVIRVNASGNITPQFQYSATPGGAPQIKRGSFFRCWPIGDNNVAKVGNWS